tara:strand:- start:393 stop:632 length:240 start_codon:yes stop_codon:yes gene_type:complete
METRYRDLEDGLMTTTEVCHFFKIAKSTVYDWADRGLIKSIKVGKTRRWLRRSVLELAAHTSDACSGADQNSRQSEAAS